MQSLSLYSYCKSSAAYRVRIALNLKSLPYQTIPIRLLPDSTENGIAQSAQDKYLAINPQGFVPALKVEQHIITQSSAIIQYLDEQYPQYPLLPTAPLARAYVRSLEQLINCDIHPVNNLRILHYLKNTLECNQTQIDTWYCHWMSEGLAACEHIISSQTYKGDYCLAEQPGLAETSLIPQLYNAHRFNCDVSRFKHLLRIEKNCLKHPAFINAAPEQQADFNN